LKVKRGFDQGEVEGKGKVSEKKERWGTGGGVREGETNRVAREEERLELGRRKKERVVRWKLAGRIGVVSGESEGDGEMVNLTKITREKEVQKCEMHV